MSLLISSFLMGATGSFAHCILMCHPFVLTISTRYALPTSQYALLVPHIKYNLGRITTYTLLGALAGGLGSLTAISPNILIFQKILLITAGIFLIIFAFKSWSFTLFKAQVITSISSPFLFGAILGFLPCGFIWGGLVNAATGMSIVKGAASMALFGVGTSIGLFITAIFGGMLLKYVKYTRWLFMLVFIVTGAMFIYKGLKL
ncbi:MAG: sulfite exporter TauE/SafE family protein [Deferribacteraceae bacterium]|nr:sulfite exporter TauE/SafE family protein [Deferribacteraceae bacterium]